MIHSLGSFAFKLRLAAFLAVLSIPYAGQAQVCRDLFRTQRAAFDTASELETDGMKVLPFLTTTDGTIRPVSQSLGAIPKPLRSALENYMGTGQDILNTPWDVLTPVEQSELIRASVLYRRQDVVGDHKAYGLKYRDKVKLTFPGDVRFLGRNLKAGTYEFLGSDVFGASGIEFSSENGATQFLGLEIHVRSNLPAVEIYHSTRALESALGFKPANLHTHIVSRISDNQILPYMHFISQVILYFEFKAIERGNPAIEIASDYERRMWPRSNNDIVRVAESLLTNTTTYSKSGLVGLKGKRFYDTDVVGIELRYLSPYLDQTGLIKALENIQARMHSQNFFLDSTYLRNFLGLRDPNALLTPEILAQSTLRILPDSVENLSIYRRVFAQRYGAEKLAQVDLAVQQNAYLKYLFVDWTNLVDFYQRPMHHDVSPLTRARIQNIDAARDIAFTMLSKNAPPKDVLKYFIKKSGLARDIFDRIENQRLN